MLTIDDPLVAAGADPELKSLHDIFIKSKSLFDTLTSEFEANPSLDTVAKSMKLNRNMTHILLLLQIKTKKAIEKHKSEIVDLESQIARQKEPKKRIARPRLFAPGLGSNGRLSCYFQHAGSRLENANPDYAAICEAGHRFSACLPRPNPWRPSDAEKLVDGVLHSLKLEKLDSLSSRAHGELSEDTLLALERELARLKEVSSAEKSRIEFVAGEPVDRDYNWSWIAKKYHNNRFSPEECQRVWHLVAKPSICKSWTPEEDLFLRQVALERSLQNWSAVNERLPKRRSEFVCFVRYQRVFERKRAARSVRTRRENAALDRASPSDLVARFAGPREAAHFRHRRRTRDKKLGLFSKRERFLISSYTARGYSCGAVARLVGGRTAKQIRDFQRAASAKRGRWSAREIGRLLEAVKYLGEHAWPRISGHVSGRSAGQCRRKFGQLKSKNLVERYFRRTIDDDRVKLSRIRKLLARERAAGSRSVDSKIESYFVRTLRAPEAATDPVLLVDSVLSLLEYLNFAVPRNEFSAEIFEWLTRGGSSRPFDDLFREHFSPEPSREFRFCGRNSSFSPVLAKSSNVLPPNRCTVKGFDAFLRNYENYAKSNENVDFAQMWKGIDARVGKRKDFLEAKIRWFSTLMAMFYWPIKLKTILPDELLKKE